MPTGNTRPLGWGGNGTRPRSAPPTPAAEINTPIRRTKRKHPPTGETSRDKFIRLATNRVTTAMYSIRLLGNLANRHVYQYEDEDVRVIRDTLHAAIEEALSQFAPKERPEIRFELVTKSS